LLNTVVIFCSYLARNKNKKNCSKYRGKRVNTREVYPNSVKTEAPKRAENDYGENEGAGNRHQRGKSWLSDSAEEALRRDGKPSEKISEAEKSYCTGGFRKQERFLGLDEKRCDGTREEEEN